MNFGDMILYLLRGASSRLAIWPAAVTVKLAPCAHGEDQLMIRREDDGKWHPWTISVSDLASIDWIVTGETAPRWASAGALDLQDREN